MGNLGTRCAQNVSTTGFGAFDKPAQWQSTPLCYPPARVKQSAARRRDKMHVCTIVRDLDVVIPAVW